jgi:TetR/AcrR family transcriptional regulator, fatty acid metabolism regulator protein
MNIHSVLPAAKSIVRPERADKREAILRAAIDVFAGRGFFNAQVADVARAAGVAAGTVYLYFRSKDDLLVSIFERTMREAIAEGRACVAPLTDPIERLRAIARMHLERMGRDRSLAIVFQVELRQSTKFMERFSSTALREYLGIIRQVIVDGQAAGVFRAEISATLAAKLFFGALDEMATNWILSRRRYSLPAHADAIVDVLANGVVQKAQAPAARATVRPAHGRPEQRRGTRRRSKAPRNGAAERAQAGVGTREHQK